MNIEPSVINTCVIILCFTVMYISFSEIKLTRFTHCILLILHIALLVILGLQMQKNNERLSRIEEQINDESTINKFYRLDDEQLTVRGVYAHK